jgi:hypothetical protein
MNNFHLVCSKIYISICFLSIFLFFKVNILYSEQCKPVFDSSVIFTTFECLNDSAALIIDSNKKNSEGWQYSTDSSKDGVTFGQVGGGDFEIYALAIKESEEYIYLVVTSNLALQGFDSNYAEDGNIGWGDLFININKTDFLTEHKNSNFYAIRFAGSNDSNASKIGVYGKVSAKSVTKQNSGFLTWESYVSHVLGKGSVPELGDFGSNQNYYDKKISLNVIDKSNYLGSIEFLNINELLDQGYDMTKSIGKSTIAFRFEKKLIIDRCGVIGGDGTSCLDCSGTACGDKVLDQCGVCGGDGTICLDCAGTPFGSVQLDQCGVCGGDGTSCLDCAGTPFGSEQIDQCGVCGGNGTSCLDCSGVVNGNLVFDQCGVCGGDGTSCLDCKGIVNGNSKFDQCGICDGDGTSCLDCAGTPFGSKQTDQCGVCGGDNSTCLDCNGKINGSAITDRCGLCNGDGTSCLGCNEININEELHLLDGAGANLKHISYGMIKNIFTSNMPKRKKIRMAKRIKSNSQNLANKVWTLAWSIPSIYLECSSEAFCITVEDKSAINNYQSNLDEFVSYLLKEARIIKHNFKKFKLKKLENEINKENTKTKKVLDSLPTANSVCSK